MADSFGGDFNTYTKADDKAILSRNVQGVGKNLSDAELSDVLDRTISAIRTRRYVLNSR